MTLFLALLVFHIRSMQYLDASLDLKTSFHRHVVRLQHSTFSFNTNNKFTAENLFRINGESILDISVTLVACISISFASATMVEAECQMR